VLQNDPFGVEEENEHDFTSGRIHLHVRFSVSEALPPLENRSSSHCIISIGLMDDFYNFLSTFSKPNTEFNRATLTLH
jgi:hypothetical protein